MKHQIILTALLATSALTTLAQDADAGAPPRGGRPPGGPGGRPLAIIAALDTNKDGVIDATEIANASAALAKLDKNGDGKLTPDEFLGPRGEGRGPGGPGGPGRRPKPNAPQE